MSHDFWSLFVARNKKDKWSPTYDNVFGSTSKVSPEFSLGSAHCGIALEAEVDGPTCDVKVAKWSCRWSMEFVWLRWLAE